jgi:hypothetical protein
MQSSARTSLDHFAPHVSQYVEGSIMVRAIAKGFYGNTLRQPGDVFGIHKEEEFGPWMERVSEDKTTSGDELDPETTPDAKTGKGGKTGNKSKGGAKATKADDDVL